MGCVGEKGVYILRWRDRVCSRRGCVYKEVGDGVCSMEGCVHVEGWSV